MSSRDRDTLPRASEGESAGLELEEQHGTGVNAIEKRAVAMLLRLAGRGQRTLHRWSDDDRHHIHGVGRHAIYLAAFAGALSGGLIGGVEVLLRDDLGEAWSEWLQQWRYWLLYLALAGLVSAIEIGAIYWMMLRKAARIASIAGLDLSHHAFEKIVALGLSRASLEMPNPRSSIYGIDPYARVPRWKLLAWTVLYRLKIGATSFVLRIMLRRMLARAAVRAFIPLIAIPVFAVWNALVTAWVMREVRIRAAGPQAVEDAGARIAEAARELPQDARRRIVQTVAESAIRAQDAHPNFVMMIDRLLCELDIDPGSISGDGIDPADRDDASHASMLQAAAAMAVLNGRTRDEQKALLCELSPDHEPDFDALDRLRKRMIQGHGLPAEDVDAVFGLDAKSSARQ